MLERAWHHGAVLAVPFGELFEDAAHDGFDSIEDVVLRHEAHLDIELVKLPGRAVSAGVLVAEAGRDLEVAVEAGHHQQLLELLRGLRECVELAGMHAARHEEVARAFGAGGGQDRRLVFGEATFDHAAAQARDHVGAQHHVLVQRLAAQVQVPVLEADLFRIGMVAEDRHRQLGGFGLDGDRPADDFDLTGGEVGVDQLAVAGDDPALNRDDAFGAQALDRGKTGGARIEDDLGQPVMVAQVNEHDPAMVPAAVQPARKLDGFTDMGLAQLPAGVGAIGVHRTKTPEKRSNIKKAGRAQTPSPLSSWCDKRSGND